MPSAGAVLQFLGATGTVTGSRFLVETPRARLLVDCGLYQGIKKLRLRNWDAFPVPPESIDAVVLTHAHIDHSGYLPALHARGFRGEVVCTRRTSELCAIVLPDSARLQEEDAAYANRKGFSKHRPALSLYTQEDAAAVLERFRPVEPGKTTEVAEGVRLTLRPTGHILGAACAHLEGEGPPPWSLAVSGDLGRAHHPLLLPPAPPPAVDALLVESTYGDRRHDEAAGVERLRDCVVRTAERGGVVVVPAFAVDRTEVVLHWLRKLTDRGEIPAVPLYADSPMALAALEVYRRAVADGDAELRPEVRGEPSPFDPGTLVEARETEESRAINEVDGPAIILSASGMATGGRVLHHLARRLPRRENSVALVGYQAAQTRGRRLLEGATSIKLLGRYVPVRAEIVDCSGLSVHADRDELLAWLGAAAAPPAVGYIVHGEPEASAALRDAVAAKLDWPAVVPRYLERVRIERG